MDRPGDYFRLDVTAPATPDTDRRLPALVRELAPLVRAEWAIASPLGAGVAIGRVRPQRRDGSPFTMPAPCLGWVMYWSVALCTRWGFAPGDTRERLFWQVERLPAGAVAQITEDPLDLDRAEHLAALTAVYEQFPEL